MANEEIIIDCFKDGTVKIEGVGFKDSTCLKATEKLEQALGTVSNRTKKTEASLAPKVGIGGVTVGKK